MIRFFYIVYKVQIATLQQPILMQKNTFFHYNFIIWIESFSNQCLYCDQLQYDVIEEFNLYFFLINNCIFDRAGKTSERKWSNILVLSFWFWCCSESSFVVKQKKLIENRNKSKEKFNFEWNPRRNFDI